ncbi:MAG: hypothetical protein HOQ02_11495 [Lysobacter sp.]|nr:hypothetical protein [Lysobacter sp.]
MEKSFLASFALVALLALPLAGARAGDADAGNAQTPAQILQTQHALRDQLDKPDGEYSHFSKDAVARIRQEQDAVFHMLDGVGSLDQLNREQQTHLSNALDHIRALLAGSEGSRLVCHRERRTGSNMIERRCQTMDEREASADAARRSFERGVSHFSGN